jgi:hypothetical protein
VKHGFPLRVVAPGWASDSWTKWVTSIRVLNKESDNFWMKTGYRHPGKPVAPGTAVPPDQMRPVTSLRVKSVIATPLMGATIAPGVATTISGVAWSGDAGPIAAVDVSVDGGRTWHAAKLGRDQSQFGWRQWEMAWTPQREAYYTIMARARDSAGDTQPFNQEWNPSGYGWNVVPRVAVNVTQQPAPEPVMTQAPTPPQAPASYRTACLTCHGNDVVEQQRLTRAQWDREINKMTGWGAPVKPEDREAILNYLTNFGPRPLR